MKKLTKLFYFLLIVSLCVSCKDEDNDPLVIHKDSNNTAPFVRIDVINPIIDFRNLEGSAYEFTLTSISDNVTSYELLRTPIIRNDTLEVRSVRTITSFPSTERVTISDLATAIEINDSVFSRGTQFDFSSIVTRTDGVEIRTEDIHSEVSGSITLSSGHGHVTFITCPFVPEDISGTYKVDSLDFINNIEIKEAMGGIGSTREVVVGPRANQITIRGGTYSTFGDSNDLIVDINQSTGQASYSTRDSLEIGRGAMGNATEFSESSYGTVKGFVYSCIGKIEIILSSQEIGNNIIERRFYLTRQ